MKKIVLFLCCLTIGIAGFAGQSLAVPVGLELFLLVDVSGSVSASEYNLQRDGYRDAFLDPDIQNAITSSTNGIAVALGEWATGQSLRINWTHLTDAASINAFSAAIGALTNPTSGNTGPGSAINWAVPQFTGNGFEGTRQVIDISGDGRRNTGANTFDAATAANSAGITVNGLPILTDDLGLDTWYQANIVTPGGGFLEVANNFQDFEDAVKRKIGREIKGVPEPTTMMLLGLGLLGLAGLRRRTK